MGGRQARRLCPEAVVVAPRWSAYVEASRALFEVFERTAPLVEGLSMEEAFLDVSGLERISGSPSDIARRLRHDVRERLGLRITVGVARTKVLAKMASREAKPDGLLVVSADGELAFLHPIRVERLWGVGPATAEKLRAHGIATVGELASLSEATLVSILGRASGRHLHALARNRDPRRPRAGRRRRSFGSQSALHPAVRSPEALDTVVIALVDRVARRMRASRRVARTVVLRLRFGDFSRVSRSQTLRRATAATRTILVTARDLLQASMAEIQRRGLTLVGVNLANLDSDGPGTQLALPVDGWSSNALDSALDEIRNRFGADAVTRAAVLGREQSLSAWLLPGDQPASRISTST